MKILVITLLALIVSITLMLFGAIVSDAIDELERK